MKMNIGPKKWTGEWKIVIRVRPRGVVLKISKILNRCIKDNGKNENGVMRVNGQKKGGWEKTWVFKPRVAVSSRNIIIIKIKKMVVWKWI